MKKVVLIADDDVAVRTMLGRFLESEGFNVVFASNGRQAISEFLIMPYDLLLLDALSKLHPMMPIIIMTALPHQQEHAERAGVDALLEKPLDLPFLLDTIHQVLARHEPVRVARRGVGALASHSVTADAPQFLSDV
jgi:DNA-binding response OmpR family regulator